MKDSDNLRVCGDTEVGWCANTPINETLDGEGNIVNDKRGFGVRDPYAPTARDYDDPTVRELRENLRQHNSIHQLDICDPEEIERAATIFWRDGFVVVRDLLDKEMLDRFREGNARVLSEILSPDGDCGRKYVTETNRLPHRYSYRTTSSSRQLLHDSVWASMVDLDITTPLLTRLFGSQDYLVLGAGGDLCLPRAVEYQHLHTDVREDFNVPESRIRQAESMGIELKMKEDSDELTIKCKRLIADRMPAVITINFLMCELTWENGPIRQIPVPISLRVIRHHLKRNRSGCVCQRSSALQPVQAYFAAIVYGMGRLPILVEKYVHCLTLSMARHGLQVRVSPRPCLTKFGKRFQTTLNTSVVLFTQNLVYGLRERV